MSRIGKKSITIPQGVDVDIEGQKIKVKGPLGSLEKDVPSFLILEKTGGALNVSVKNPEERAEKIRWGTERTLIDNMINGVSKGFSKSLELSGVGYRAALSGEKLILNVGFSHPSEFTPPQDVKIEVNQNTITVKGISKELVGEVASRIRRIKKPEPYKGKGIKYAGETIRRKAGKLVKTAA